MGYEYITLTMSPDNPASTTFTDESGEPLYVVVTENLDKVALTHVRDASTQKTIGTLSWKDSTPGSAKVSLGGSEEFVEFSKWMNKSHIPSHHDLTFKAPDGETYKWTGYSGDRALCLWTKDDNVHPVARFYKSHFEGSDEPRTLVKAQFLVDTRIDHLLDIVVTSFVFVEKFRRHREYSMTGRGNARSGMGGFGAVGFFGF